MTQKTEISPKESFLQAFSRLAERTNIEPWELHRVLTEYTVMGSTLEIGVTGTCKQVGVLALEAFVQVAQDNIGDGFGIADSNGKIILDDAILYDYRIRNGSPQIAEQASELLCSLTVQPPNCIR